MNSIKRKKLLNGNYVKEVGGGARDSITSALVMKDLVFINYRTGEPAKNSSYDTHLYKLCDEANIRRFCLHTLRHTFATRMVESGANFKFLSSILGHASIKTTLDRYSHTTNDSMLHAMQQFEMKMKETMA